LPLWTCASWPTGRVAKNDSKGSCVVAQSDRSTEPGRRGWPFLAGPCPNFKGANGLKKRSNLPDGEDALAIPRGRCRNCKALKGLKGCENMVHKSRRARIRAQRRAPSAGTVPRCFPLATSHRDPVGLRSGTTVIWLKCMTDFQSVPRDGLDRDFAKN
jgi:hypothetical protein